MAAQRDLESPRSYGIVLQYNDITKKMLAKARK